MFHLLRFQRRKHKSRTRHSLIKFVFFSSGLVSVVALVVAIVVKFPTIRTDGKAEVGRDRDGKESKEKELVERRSRCAER